jgi:hypothetical protein
MIIAELKTWNGKIIKEEIKREWIDLIVVAIENQMFVKSNKDKFSINGKDFKHVDIYEVEE